MREGRRERTGQLGVFISGETFEDTNGIFAGFDILELELEEFLDRGPHIAMGSREEIGKGDRTRGAAGGGVNEGAGGGRQDALLQTCH